MSRKPYMNADAAQNPRTREPRLMVDDQRQPPAIEEWEYHKDTILGLYENQKLKYKQIREYMIRNYSFSAPVSAYTCHVHRWGRRRNLKESDVAHMVRLLRSSRQLGLDVEFDVSGFRKTPEQIKNYLLGKKLTEEGILSLINDQMPTPAYITPCTVSEPDAVSTMSQAATNLRPQHRPTFDYIDQEASTVAPTSWSTSQTPRTYQSSATPSSSMASEHMDEGPSSLHDRQAEHDFHPTVEGENEVEPGAYFLHSETEWHGQSRGNELCQVVKNGAAFMPSVAFLLAPQYQQNHGEIYAVPSMLMSTTPPNAMENTVLPIAQRYSRLGVDPPSWPAVYPLSRYYQFSPASHDFLAKCFGGCMSEGQGLSDQASSLIGEAMGSFHHIVRAEAGECLTTLHLLVAFLGVHNQQKFAKKILDEAKVVSTSMLGRQNPITATVLFMGCIADDTVSDAEDAKIERLQQVYQSLREAYKARAPSTLTALYNVAWRLAEAKRDPEACVILSELRNECEVCFGPHHIQTVTTITTMARAKYHLGDKIEANSLFEKAIGRLNEIYPPWHPYLLEAMHRQAYCLLKLDWSQQAKIVLRHVIYHRFAILGSQNPKSQDSFALLKKHLTECGRQREAEDLFIEYADGNCVNEDYQEHPSMAF